MEVYGLTREQPPARDLFLREARGRFTRTFPVSDEDPGFAEARTQDELDRPLSGADRRLGEGPSNDSRDATSSEANDGGSGRAKWKGLAQSLPPRGVSTPDDRVSGRRAPEGSARRNQEAPSFSRGQYARGSDVTDFNWLEQGTQSSTRDTADDSWAEEEASGNSGMMSAGPSGRRYSETSYPVLGRREKPLSPYRTNERPERDSRGLMTRHKSRKEREAQGRGPYPTWGDVRTTSGGDVRTSPGRSSDVRTSSWGDVHPGNKLADTPSLQSSTWQDRSGLIGGGQRRAPQPSPGVDGRRPANASDAAPRNWEHPTNGSASLRESQQFPVRKRSQAEAGKDVRGSRGVGQRAPPAAWERSDVDRSDMARSDVELSYLKDAFRTEEEVRGPDAAPSSKGHNARLASVSAPVSGIERSRRGQSPKPGLSSSAPEESTERPTAVSSPSPGASRLQQHAQGSPRPVVPREAKPSGPACYACGATLQTQFAEAPGFVPLETFALKKQHRQLSSLACLRCRQLAHGRLIAAVGGHGGYRIEAEEGVPLITADDLRDRLKHVAQQKALILKLVDILDINGSFISRIRDIVGANPIILVITKIDLLPEGTSLDAVGDWVLEFLAKKKLNVVAVHLTSAKAQHGFSAVAASIHRERQGRDVYVMGAANVGKSAFISSLLDEMASRDPMASAARRRKPITSAVPGTTLGPIQLKAFAVGGDLYDTPGVHLHHRTAAALWPQDLKALAFKRRLRGYTVGGPKQGQGQGLQGSAVFWGGIVRVDVLQAPPNLSLTFFGPTDIKVLSSNLAEADDFYEAELGKSLVPPTTSMSSAETWPGLESVQAVSLPIPSTTSPSPLADVAISGLGWFQVSLAPDSIGKGDSAGISVEDILAGAPLVSLLEDGSDDADQVTLVVHCPKGIELFVRPPVPVGLAATAWYQYADLDEDEEQARPELIYEARSVS